MFIDEIKIYARAEGLRDSDGEAARPGAAGDGQAGAV